MLKVMFNKWYPGAMNRWTCRVLGGLVVGLGLGLGVGCGEDEAEAPATEGKGFPTAEAQQAITTYKAIAHGVYGESLGRTKALQGAIEALVAAPDEAKLTAAKQAWVDARVIYNQNDVFRAIDASLADAITADLDTAVSKLEALAGANDSKPFDVVLAEPDGSPARNETVEVIKALRGAADGLSLGASRLGLTLTLEEPSEEL